MDKARWQQIKKGMEKDGWRCVCELHPGLPKDIRESLIADHKANYPEEQFQHQFYHSHNAYLCFFTKPIPQLAAPRPTLTARQEEFLNHDFYKQSEEYRNNIKRGQILKGADKYEEPFTPRSWTDQELMDHAMMENVDQEHYIVGQGHRNRELRGVINTVTTMMVALETHLQMGHEKVKGMALHNPIKINHARSQMVVEKMLEVLRSVDEDK